MGSGSTGAYVGQRFGTYELLAPLAQGGTSEIFLARMRGTAGFEKLLVVKRLLDHLAEDPEYVAMFLDEARLGARLDHTNIVQTIDLGREEGRYYIAMEYLAGLSLASLARRSQERVDGGLPMALSLEVLIQAAAGLHYAHERTLPDGTPLRLVHRDISPQNLVVTYEGVVKVVDFGIAHASAQVRDAQTKSGFIKGKFAYMSPEQCKGQPLDRRTDVFALGVIAHELVTGRRLFKRSSTYLTYQAIVNGEVPRPSATNPALGPEVDEVILRALAYRPEDRYPTAEAFGEAMQQLSYRSGRHASAGDVRRYFERHFCGELEAHERQMAELMAGQTRSVVLHAPWDADEGIEDPEDAGATRVDHMDTAASASLPAPPPQPSANVPTVGLRVTPPTAAPPAPAPAAAPPARPPAPPPAPAAAPPVRPPLPPPPAPLPDAFATPPSVAPAPAVARTDAIPRARRWIYPLAFTAAVGVGIGLSLLIRALA